MARKEPQLEGSPAEDWERIVADVQGLEKLQVMQLRLIRELEKQLLEMAQQTQPH